MTRLLCLLLFVTACFGAGPAPTPPTGAQVVFVTPPSQQSSSCTGFYFINTVAFSPTSGYGILDLYQPTNNNCGGPPPPTPISIYQFDPDGASPQGVSIGGAGNSMQTPTPIATNAVGGVYWTVSSAISSAGSNTVANLTFGGMTGSFQALGMVGGASRLFLYGQTGGGGFIEPPWTPTWPCCGTGGNTSGQMAGLFTVDLPLAGGSVAATAIGGTTVPLCDELKQCLVGNGTELYYMRQGDVAQGSVAVIDRVTKPLGPVSTLDTIATTLSPSATPVGLAATETHVAWAVANNGHTGNQVQPGCWIFARDLSQPSGRLLLQSSKFSCLDVSVDDTAVYFTIVVSQQQNDCNGCQEPIHGIGIARVSFDGSTYESLSIAMSGYYSGPRRVFVTPDSVYVADPFAIAKIAKTALDGKQDIPYQ